MWSNFCYYKVRQMEQKWKYNRSWGITRGGSRTATTSKMEHFVVIGNGWKPLIIIKKRSILDVAAFLDPPLITKVRYNRTLVLSTKVPKFICYLLNDIITFDDRIFVIDTPSFIPKNHGQRYFTILHCWNISKFNLQFFGFDRALQSVIFSNSFSRNPIWINSSNFFWSYDDTSMFSTIMTKSFSLNSNNRKFWERAVDLIN